HQLHTASVFTAEKTIIIGGSRIGIYLAERLKLHGKEAVIVEMDNKKFKELEQMGLRVVAGNGMDLDLYKNLNLQPENYVVVLSGSEQHNVAISEMVKKELEHERIITDVVQDRYLRYLDKLGIVDLDVRRIVASAIENMIFRPDTYQYLFEEFGEYSVQDITVSNHEIDGKFIREIPFHREGSLMAIHRDGTTLIPHGDTYIKVGDIVTVIGMDSAMQDFRKKFT
ncbi:MAG: NAD-binding protein, partial [Saprospiraceae bacterium]|nr:NAD-binding protein [Saprospiraceae bacterium]